jgi:HEAT repeat protein
VAAGRWRRRGRSAAVTLVAGALACGPSECEQLSITKAVATGQHGRIELNFSYVVYDHRGSMAPLLGELRPLLAHPDPYVRAITARYLYWVGDTSGYAVLLALVESPEPVPEFGYDRERHHLTGEQLGKDLRIEAASILGEYRQREALPAIAKLYAIVPDSRVAIALVTLGNRSDGERGFEPLRARYYGIVGAREFIPQLVSTFETTPDPEIKTSAAWALARMTGEDRYVEFLAGLARSALDPAASEADRHLRLWTTLQYLGSLEHPLAHQVLEEALDSKYPVAVEYATVNLLVNQADGSEKARQAVLRQLRGEHHLLQWEPLLNLAAALDDAEIAAAGEAFDRRSDPSPARRPHRDRPLYDWIDDYVLVLRDPPPRVRPERLLRAPALSPARPPV